MNILLRHAIIVDSSSPFHLKTSDIFIEDGIITAIASKIDKEATVVDIKGLHVSPGWFDVFADFADPGFEFRETMETGARAAAAGGYTDVMVIPNTAPSIHNKAAVEYVVQKSKSLPVTVHPIGAVTKNAEGKELAEMYDMHASGAAAFGDGIKTILSSGLLIKALQYLKAIDKTLIQVPDDKTISAGGLMNEGIISTQLGLPGKPAIAEELMIARDIELVKYTDSKIHFTGISTAASVQLIKKAKEEGLSVTCSVTPYHLMYSDEDLTTYDTYLKVNPPLRTSADREALKNAVVDGTIDCIASHHLPQDTDHKIIEFEYAADGMETLETAFAVVATVLPQLSTERLVELFSINPRKIFGFNLPAIKEKEMAFLTLFTKDQWTVEVSNIISKSKNTAFIGKQLNAKPVGIINKDRLFLNPQ